MKLQLLSKDQELQATVFIRRDQADEDKVEYTVQTPYSPEGYICVSFRDLEFFQENGDPLAERLEPLVLEDAIAEITHFFPYQTPIATRIPRHLVGRGIGTTVLRTVMRDLWRNQNIRHFYVQDPATPFYNLLLANRFKELRVPGDPFHEHLYRRLKQPDN